MRAIFLGIAATIVLSAIAGIWLNGSIQRSAEQRYVVPTSVRL